MDDLNIGLLKVHYADESCNCNCTLLSLRASAIKIAPLYSKAENVGLSTIGEILFISDRFIIIENCVLVQYSNGRFSTLDGRRQTI